MNHFQTRKCGNHDIDGDLAVYKCGTLVGCLETLCCGNAHGDTPATHSKQESWEEKICTCNKPWLGDNNHYRNCPVFVVSKVLAAERQAAAAAEREAILAELPKIVDANHSYYERNRDQDLGIELLANKIREYLLSRQPNQQ